MSRSHRPRPSSDDVWSSRRRHPTSRPVPERRGSKTYVGLLAIITTLNLIGLVMVLSASSVVGPRRLRVLLVRRDAPGHVAGARHRGLRDRAPRRLPPLAPPGHARPPPDRRAAGPRAGARGGRHGQRRLALARLRAPVAPAVGARQAHRAALRGRPARPPGRMDGRHPPHARARHRRVRHDRPAAHAAAEPRHHPRARRDRAGAPLRGRHAVRAPGRPGDGGGRGRDGHGPLGPVPARSGAGLPRPVGRLPEHRLPEHPIPGRRGLGRDHRHRVWARAGPSGASFPTPTRTSSSPSSARSWA